MLDKVFNYPPPLFASCSCCKKFDDDIVITIPGPGSGVSPELYQMIAVAITTPGARVGVRY